MINTAVKTDINKQLHVLNSDDIMISATRWAVLIDSLFWGDSEIPYTDKHFHSYGLLSKEIQQNQFMKHFITIYFKSIRLYFLICFNHWTIFVYLQFTWNKLNELYNFTLRLCSFSSWGMNYALNVKTLSFK